MALRPSKDHTEAAAALAGLVDDRRPLHREDLPHQPGQVGQGPAEPPVVGVQDGLELLVAGPVFGELTTCQLPGARTLPRMWTTLMKDSPLTSMPRIVPCWNR